MKKRDRPIADLERLGAEICRRSCTHNNKLVLLPVHPPTPPPPGCLSLWSVVTLTLVSGSGVDSKVVAFGFLLASAAAAGRGVDGLALDLDVGFLRGAGRGPGAHPLLNLGRHGHEGLLHVGGALGTGLQEGDSQVVGKFLVKEKE